MDSTLLEWLNLALRWFHFVVGIGWIGTSFYYVWLDSQLEAPARPREGVEGELWMVHSGGFYQVEKRRLGPGQVPATLHWFKWEAALTWVSGIGLLAVVYYLTGGIYLVDPAVSHITPGAATLLALALLVVSWVVYDLLWVSPLAQRSATTATLVSVVLLFGVVYGLCRTLSGRAAYMHVGAMLGTIMVANVWMRILPAQRQMIAATRAGQRADYTLGERAKRRSVHNSYVTFPVLFIMLSHHYPSTYGHALNWLVLALVIVVGMGVRHLMITGERRRPARWVLVPVAAATAALVYLTSPAWRERPSASTGGAPVSFAVARRIVDLRCTSCHSQAPTDDIFRVAPNGITFDTPASIKRQAETIRLRTLVVRNMPLANKTGMTEAERELLGRWIDQGARLD